MVGLQKISQPKTGESNRNKGFRGRFHL